MGSITQRQSNIGDFLLTGGLRAGQTIPALGDRSGEEWRLPPVGMACRKRRRSGPSIRHEHHDHIRRWRVGLIAIQPATVHTHAKCAFVWTLMDVYPLVQARRPLTIGHLLSPYFVEVDICEIEGPPRSKNGLLLIRGVESQLTNTDSRIPVTVLFITAPRFLEYCATGRQQDWCFAPPLVASCLCCDRFPSEDQRCSVPQSVWREADRRISEDVVEDRQAGRSAG
jgi:hypothetical protein